MKFNPENWKKLSESQRLAIIKKVEREERRAKAALWIIAYILVVAFLLYLFTLLSC